LNFSNSAIGKLINFKRNWTEILRFTISFLLLLVHFLMLNYIALINISPYNRGNASLATLYSFPRLNGFGAPLFIKVPRPGDSKETFSVFESSCHLLLPV